MQLVLVQPQLSHSPEQDNTRAIQDLLVGAKLKLGHDDIVLLPEHHHLGSAEAYSSSMGELARFLGCHLVAGSHHEPTTDGTRNAGNVFAPDGTVLARYEKLRPYAAERDHVGPGSKLTAVEVGGRQVLVLLCADFWFSDLILGAPAAPDLVLVPALSVTRKPSPDYSRALWRHLAIARAYEFGVYVGVSDWGYPSELPALFTSGVAGFADPTTTTPEALFRALGDNSIGVFNLDFRALDAFKADRQARGFFWQTALPRT